MGWVVPFIWAEPSLVGLGPKELDSCQPNNSGLSFGLGWAGLARDWPKLEKGIIPPPKSSACWTNYRFAYITKMRGERRKEEGRSLPGMGSCWWRGWWSRRQWVARGGRRRSLQRRERERARLCAYYVRWSGSCLWWRW